MTAVRLPYDEARCVGRRADGDHGLPYGGPEPAGVCPRRESCVRYLAWVEHPRGQAIPNHVPVHNRLCVDGEDHFIPETNHG